VGGLQNMVERVSKFVYAHCRVGAPSHPLWCAEKHSTDHRSE